MHLQDCNIVEVLPAAKPYKLADGKGLYLLVQPSGTKLWRHKYRFYGIERKQSLGRWPEISLEVARQKRDEARDMIADGHDPVAMKRQAELEARISAASTFKAIAEEYIEKMRLEGRKAATLAKARWLLRVIDTRIGHRPINEITPHELLAALRVIEARGHRETAHRLRAFAGRVFRYAVVTLRAQTNPADILRGALVAPRVTHRPAIIDPKEVGALLRAIEDYTGHLETRIALQLAPHVFVRPGELRHAEWTEIDFVAAVWKIPAEKMKMAAPHAVPLSRQALALFDVLRRLGRPSRYVFPAIHSIQRPMSDNTLNCALRRIGYAKEEMTAHGFRATASTLLNESGLWHPDAIERALAHKDSNRVRAAYHRGAHWDERVRMAQWWSDQLDSYRRGGDVIPLAAKR